jgi:hypothetical protein
MNKLITIVATTVIIVIGSQAQADYVNLIARGGSYYSAAYYHLETNQIATFSHIPETKKAFVEIDFEGTGRQQVPWIMLTSCDCPPVICGPASIWLYNNTTSANYQICSFSVTSGTTTQQSN